MKAEKSVDFRDRPELIEMLRTQAAWEGRTQKAIVVQALESYFAHRQESLFVPKIAEQSFQEWENEDNQVYDSL